MSDLKITLFAREQNQTFEIPLVSGEIKAGFPSPADDFIESRLDLNELIIQHPSATFFARVGGHSMEGAGILDGDILVIDRSVSPTNGAIVIARFEGEFTVKRIRILEKTFYLSAEHPDYPDFQITDEVDFEVWGVVTYIIHKAS